MGDHRGNDWNYVGDGINGGQRVLSAIGKETDDVVFVSGDVRQEIIRSAGMNLILGKMENKGRRADKHNKPWRVYQLNHSGIDLTEDGDLIDLHQGW